MSTAARYHYSWTCLIGSEQATFLLVNVCCANIANIAFYGDFFIFRFTFEEGAWTKVPKTVRTFANLMLNNTVVNRPENLWASLFDLNLTYSYFLANCQPSFCHDLVTLILYHHFQVSSAHSHRLCHRYMYQVGALQCTGSSDSRNGYTVSDGPIYGAPWIPE